MIIIGVIFAIICLLIAGYIGIRLGRGIEREELAPKLQQTETLNEQIIADNLQQETIANNLKHEISNLEAKKDSILTNINDLQIQADNTAELYEKKAIEVAQLKIEASLTEQSAKYEAAAQEYENEYLNTIRQAAADLQTQLNEKISQLNKINSDINTFKATREALIQANLREQEMLDSVGFHTVSLSEQDITDINTLERIKPTLFKPEILSKLIWSTYFLQPVSSMCNNIFGTGKVCGIYKITNLATKEVYIGQSVDCAERIKQHIKAGLGIDNKGTNKLYKAMQKNGAWNFAFELLEKCPREELDKKEKEYIAIYESDKFGYNSTKGNG